MRLDHRSGPGNWTKTTAILATSSATVEARLISIGRNGRVAVSMVLNYEEGGEYSVLHGDAHSEFVLTDVGAEPLAGARNLNIESTFEYGSRVGFWEVLRVLRERRVEATIYAVGMALERNPPSPRRWRQRFRSRLSWLPLDRLSVHPGTCERADMLRMSRL